MGSEVIAAYIVFEEALKHCDALKLTLGDREKDLFEVEEMLLQEKFEVI